MNKDIFHTIYKYSNSIPEFTINGHVYVHPAYFFYKISFI